MTKAIRTDANTGGPQVTRGLNLSLKLKDPALMAPLLHDIAQQSKAIHTALYGLHYVHFARFLPVAGGSILMVITEYDGELDAYALDFVIVIGDLFDRILQDVEDYDPAWLPVREHPEEFIAFVRAHDEVTIQVDGNNVSIPFSERLISVYPRDTVLDIQGPRRTLPEAPADATAPESPIDLDDVQGNILRGMAFQRARHFPLELRDPAKARAWVRRLIDGDANCPKISRAAPWGTTRPDYGLTIGWTHGGLKAIGVPEALTGLFDAAFQAGPAGLRAAANGDGRDRPNSTVNWVLGNRRVHLLLSLYATDASVLDAQTQLLLRTFAEHDLVCVQGPFDAAALPGGAEAFGYQDGIAQPRIAGVHGSGESPDMQPLARVGDFLLGRDYTDVYGGSSLRSLPAALASNGTFCAVRLMAQDVEAFDRVLDNAAQNFGVDRELIAAKLMGRWRDGTPLASQDPSYATPGGSDTLNAFDYAPNTAHPEVLDDFHGLRCPVGAHIRRMNPRSGLVAGHPHSRRLLRRGMPASWNDIDGKPAVGIFGMFLCSDLERQFEFMLRIWGNQDYAASGIRDTRDPIIASLAHGELGTFRCTLGQPPREVTLRLPQLVTTHGSLYLFMPGLAGLAFLADLPEKAVPAVTPAASMTMTTFAAAVGPLAAPLALHGFDPTDPDFLKNPYATYESFRANEPVARFYYPPGNTSNSSVWVFSRERIDEVFAKEVDHTAPGGTTHAPAFLKMPVGADTEARGLFTMDPPDHAIARQQLRHIPGITATIVAAQGPSIAQALIDGIKKMDLTGPVDLVSAFAMPFSMNMLIATLGGAQLDSEKIRELVNDMLEFRDWTRSAQEQQAASKAGQDLGRMMFIYMLTHQPAEKTILGELKRWGTTSEPPMTAIHRAGHAASFAIGGFLSVEWLTTLGLFHTLRDPAQKAKMQHAVASAAANPDLLKNAIHEIARFDPLFQILDRVAAQDCVLGGVPITAGERVMLVVASANRDTAWLADADTFDLARSPTPGPGLAFGGGPHACIAYLQAMHTATVAFTELFKAFPNMQLRNPANVRFTGNAYFRRISQLMVHLV